MSAAYFQPKDINLMCELRSASGFLRHCRLFICLFISDVVTRQGQNRDKTINITVQKRNNVDWNYVVDSSGNKTTVGL